MALNIRLLGRQCYFVNITKPIQKWNIQKSIPLRVISSNISYYNHKPLVNYGKEKCPLYSVRYCSNQGKPTEKIPNEPEPRKPGLIQRFKQMYRDYWYVLLPVHCTTSALWFGGFYYAVRSGVDVIAILQSVGISEAVIAPFRDSSAGYLALTFALYKVASPLRYAATVGVTTFAIRKLTTIGWIKPVPSRERIKEIFQEKKDNIQDRIQESKQHYQSQMQEKKSQVMDEMRRYKSEMRNLKNKVKKM